MVTYYNFEKLVGKRRIIKTRSTRSAVAVGNENFVTLISLELGGITLVGGLIPREKPDYITRVDEMDLKYYTTVFAYEDAYIYREDEEPFDSGVKLAAGVYIVYVGFEKRKNYVLFVRRVQ